jgi:restriction system protein
VFWAASYLRKAGLLEGTRRGYVRITAIGRDVLAQKPARIDIQYLSRFPSFVGFKAGGATAPVPALAATLDVTPEERIESSWQEMRRELGDDLLARIKGAPPAFFERLVVRLLVEMGYGGSFADAGRSIGRSGDGGIDGIIKEDKLGLDAVYVQAKRWENQVGRPIVQTFAGSLDGVRARKGVFITTSGFSQDAKDYVKQIEKKIVLIDGPTLIDLLLDHGVAVTTTRSFSIQKIDLDYFDGDQP